MSTKIYVIFNKVHSKLVLVIYLHFSHIPEFLCQMWRVGHENHVHRFLFTQIWSEVILILICIDFLQGNNGHERNTIIHCTVLSICLC